MAGYIIRRLVESHIGNERPEVVTLLRCETPYKSVIPMIGFTPHIVIGLEGNRRDRGVGGPLSCDHPLLFRLINVRRLSIVTRQRLGPAPTICRGLFHSQWVGRAGG